MGGDVDVPTLRAQELQIGNGRFSAGQDYERSAGRDRLSWGNHGEPHGWLLRQRVEIVEIGNAGQHGYGYFNGAFHACVRFFQCYAILGGQLPHRSQPGNNAKTLPSCKRSEEHTSELQSLMRISYAVYCLKKKKNTTHTKDTHKNNNQTQHTQQQTN